MMSCHAHQEFFSFPAATLSFSSPIGMFAAMHHSIHYRNSFILHVMQSKADFY